MRQKHAAYKSMVIVCCKTAEERAQQFFLHVAPSPFTWENLISDYYKKVTQTHLIFIRTAGIDPLLPSSCLAACKQVLRHFEVLKQYSVSLMYQSAFTVCWKAFKAIIWYAFIAHYSVTFTLCNGTCWLPSGFSLFHIHTFCILTWSLRWDLIWFKLQLSIHDSAMHILHQPVAKVNSYCITWLFKLLAVNADPSETPISCAKCLNNFLVLISNHAWIP